MPMKPAILWQIKWSSNTRQSKDFGHPNMTGMRCIKASPLKPSSFFVRQHSPPPILQKKTTWKRKNDFWMDCAVNQRLNLSERNCINLCERYSQWAIFQRIPAKLGSVNSESVWIWPFDLPKMSGAYENYQFYWRNRNYRNNFTTPWALGYTQSWPTTAWSGLYLWIDLR